MKKEEEGKRKDGQSEAQRCAGRQWRLRSARVSARCYPTRHAPHLTHASVHLLSSSLQRSSVGCLLTERRICYSSTTHRLYLRRVLTRGRLYSMLLDAASCDNSKPIKSSD